MAAGSGSGNNPRRPEYGPDEAHAHGEEDTMRGLTSGMLAVALLPTVLPTAAAAQAHDEEFLRRGRIVFELFSQGRLDELWEYFGPEMRGMAVSVAQFGKFRENVLARFGRETELIGEAVVHADDLIVYERRGRFEHAERPVLVRWSFHPDGLVARFHIGEDGS
jgi:hypothetical protein